MENTAFMSMDIKQRANSYQYLESRVDSRVAFSCY
jgi:hypothetical protein